VVVDITNPVDWQTFDGLVTPPESSAAEEIQKAAPGGARVVKAFNTTFAGTLVEGQVAGQPLDVFIAGDDRGAKEKVAQLVRDGGLVAIDAGPLRRARQLEGLGFLGMTLQQPLGLNFRSAWKLIS
jgi:predicted dinucleotide-binding enzyme